MRSHSCAVVATALVFAAGWVHAQEAAAPREQELLAVIRSETPEADKALAFKGLAVHGSPACVADVATYLGNERLSSWARITLEAIPGDEASAALRAAAGPGTPLGSRQLTGVINSLGVRRDAAAVPLLVARLGDGDPNVAGAAAAALGTIVTADAAAALSQALATGTPDRDTVAEACVVCGERLAAAGTAAAATALFDAVRTADVSEQRRAEAWRAAILARGREGVPLLVELLQAPSQRLFNMGLFTSREFAAGTDRDAALAYEVDLALLKAASSSGPLPADRAALVIDLLADRNAGGASAAVQQALLESAAAGEPVVRMAAIRAVGRCGDAAAADRLLDLAEQGDAAIVAAARQAIAAMTADGVDEQIVARLDAGTALPLVVGLIGDRRILAASAKVQPLADHADPAVRAAAIAALGSIVSLPDLGILVRRVARPRDDAEAAAATTALKEAAVRMADRDGCAAVIAEAIGSAGPRAGVLVDTLADVGGATALATVAAAAKSGDQPLQDAATRVLGKWMTADAAPVLLDLSTTDKAGSYRGRALKGYLRIARQFALPETERAEMCRRALTAAQDPADRKAVIEILVRYPHAATLAVAKEAVALPDVADEAKAAVTAIEAKLGKN
ncbi:MAG: HEAT repeat domain-containing protein [Planctomycetaceae bacterium]